MMKRIIAGCMTAALCAVLLLAPGVQAAEQAEQMETLGTICLLYTSPSPRDRG